MVLGVCRRVLGNHHDAEDAFQATFLVLIRKAASVMPREKVANWLYGVAYQTALKSRATSARRRAKEGRLMATPEPAASEQDFWREVQPLLDEELNRLPSKYREPIILCELMGKTRKEVARQLSWPEGTVSGRLARARKMLASRLARRGVALSVGALAAALSQNAASAGMPTSLVGTTVKAASVFAAGQAAAAGVLSAKVAALTEGVLKSMLLTKLKIATAVLAATSLVAGAGFGLSRPLGFAHAAKAAEARGDSGQPPSAVAPRLALADGKKELAGEDKDADLDELRAIVKKLKAMLDQQNKLVDEKNRLLDELKKDLADQKGLLQEVVPDPKRRPLTEKEPDRDELRKAVADLKKAIAEKNSLLDMKNKTLNEKNALIDDLKKALRKDEPAKGGK